MERAKPAGRAFRQSVDEKVDESVLWVDLDKLRMQEAILVYLIT